MLLDWPAARADASIRPGRLLTTDLDPAGSGCAYVGCGGHHQTLAPNPIIASATMRYRTRSPAIVDVDQSVDSGVSTSAYDKRDGFDVKRVGR
jgi:hypothetical protein